jgi:diguanylate cyclase (GGDEF)-like protein
MCELVRSDLFEAEGEYIPITVSLGVADSCAGDQELNDLVKRADEGLYKAKAEGRDRVAWIAKPGNSG